MVREIFEMARTKKPASFSLMKLTQLEVSLASPLPSPPCPSHLFPSCTILAHYHNSNACTSPCPNVPPASSPPGTRFSDGDGSSNEVQRTMLELINQLDGFNPRGNIKVLMATNRPDTLDPALLRPGRMDRKIEFGLPDLEVGT